MASQPEFSSLHTSLLDSKLQKKDYALYQTVKLFIDKTQQFQRVTNTELDKLTKLEFPINGIFLTATDTNPAILFRYGTWTLFATGAGTSGNEIVITMV